MSEAFIAQFVNDDIKTEGGNADPINARIGRRNVGAATAVNNTNTVIAYEKGIMNTLGSPNPASGSYATAMNFLKLLEGLLNQRPTRVVKSRQEGLYTASSYNPDGPTYVDITVTTVDMNSVAVIIDKGAPSNTSGVAPHIYARMQSANVLRLHNVLAGTGSNRNMTPVYWQLIEYS